MSSKNSCNVVSPNECETCKSRKEPMIRISKRTNISNGKAWGIRAIALLLALVVSGFIIFIIVKLSPLKIYAAMGIKTAGKTPQAPAVGAATIRRIQALDSPVHSATAITSLMKLPEIGFPTAA